MIHYLSRPHRAARRTKLEGPAAWEGREIAAREAEWSVPLGPADVDEVLRAVRRVVASGKPVGELTREDLVVPRLAPRIEMWRAELSRGRGFVRIRGVPVERWTVAEAEVFFWCFGLHLGIPGKQNERGDLVGHVRDLEPVDEQRLYETSKELRYHCDGADVVGLLCLHTAREGGQSRIASSVAVFNRIIDEHPELVSLLFEPFALDTHAQRGIDFVPVSPCRHSRDVLRTFYHGDYFRSGATKSGTASPERLRLLDVYEEIAMRPSMRLDMDLAPGDLQLVSNHVVVHSRTAYVDHDDPDRRRHLLRLWLSLPDAYHPSERISVERERLTLVARMGQSWLSSRWRRAQTA